MKHTCDLSFTFVMRCLYSFIISSHTSLPASLCHTIALKASGMPSRTRDSSCFGLVFVCCHLGIISCQVNRTSAEQSLDTSPVPLNKGSSGKHSRDKPFRPTPKRSWRFYLLRSEFQRLHFPTLWSTLVHTFVSLWGLMSYHAVSQVNLFKGTGASCLASLSLRLRSAWSSLTLASLLHCFAWLAAGTEPAADKLATGR